MTMTALTAPLTPADLKRIALDAACATFRGALAAYTSGNLRRLDADKEWRRWSLKRSA